jgi:DNA (cytosine-5)-methyltransferase 1
MNHGSLFSGIGGFDLAAHWMGWRNVFHCEINHFCRQVLNFYWPDAASHDDITQTDFTIYRGRIDVLSGGFPCQPFSAAGKRKGTEDSRYLWPAMLDAIKQIEPSYIVGENVFGLVNWDAGLVFEQVCSDLEIAGYQVAPVVIPAAAVNAPHGRDRVWFVAYRNRTPTKHAIQTGWNLPAGHDAERLAADTDNQRLEGKTGQRVQTNARRGKQIQNGKPLRMGRENDWQNFPTQSPVCGGDDGLSGELDAITLSKWRTESIKAYGNAVVPQIPYRIFHTIQQLENDNHNATTHSPGSQK